jgi:hypothetical protein
MKKNISLILILVASISGLLWSCSKQTTTSFENIATSTKPTGSAFIKIVHFSPAFRLATAKSDSINVFLNDVKLNGSFLTFGSMFPSTTNLYAAVPAGVTSLKLSTNGVLTPDSIAVISMSKILEPGKYYSLIITDSILNASPSKQIFTQDNFVISDTTTFTMRLVHAILNDTAGKTIDVYSTRRASNIFANISPGTVTDFTVQPYNFITDTIIVRRSGGTFELARLTTASVPLARQRAYTLIYKGTPSTTTAPKGRALLTYTNQ